MFLIILDPRIQENTSNTLCGHKRQRIGEDYEAISSNSNDEKDDKM